MTSTVIFPPKKPNTLAKNRCGNRAQGRGACRSHEKPARRCSAGPTRVHQFPAFRFRRGAGAGLAFHRFPRQFTLGDDGRPASERSTTSPAVRRRKRRCLKGLRATGVFSGISAQGCSETRRHSSQHSSQNYSFMSSLLWPCADPCLHFRRKPSPNVVSSRMGGDRVPHPGRIHMLRGRRSGYRGTQSHLREERVSLAAGPAARAGPSNGPGLDGKHRW